MKITPLQMALMRNEEKKPCKECKKSIRIREVLYCRVTGKIILPMFEDIQVCRGEYLKRD